MTRRRLTPGAGTARVRGIASSRPLRSPPGRCCRAGSTTGSAGPPVSQHRDEGEISTEHLDDGVVQHRGVVGLVEGVTGARIGEPQRHPIAVHLDDV